MNNTYNNFSNTFDKVKKLIGSAQANRDFEDYDDALKNLDDAISLGEGLLSGLEEKNYNQDNFFLDKKIDLVRKISDCYGMKGGVFRRMKSLTDAEEMYALGSAYENKYSINSTYNRVNVIVLRLLRDIGEYSSLRKIIFSSMKVIENQVSGKNKNMWWSWADYGLLNILIAALDDEKLKAYYYKEAHRSYVRFKEAGARHQHLDSALSVLIQLNEKIKSPIIEEEINYLKE